MAPAPRKDQINPSMAIDRKNYNKCAFLLSSRYDLTFSHAIDIVMEHFLSHGSEKHNDLTVFFEKYRKTRSTRHPTTHELKWEGRREKLLELFKEYSDGIRPISACIRLRISKLTLDRLIKDHMDGRVYKDYIRLPTSNRKKVILRLK